MKRLLFTLLVAVTLIAPAGANAAPDSAGAVVGTWIFYANFPQAPAPVYVGTARFMKDGTVSGSPPDQHAGATFGEWVRTGPSEFAFTFVSDSYDGGGNLVNTHRVRGKLTLSDDGLTATGRTLLEILDPSGQVIFTARDTTTFSGTRIIPLPLPE